MFRSQLKKNDSLGNLSEKKFEELRSSLTLVLPHELRIPLQGILGFADVLLTEHETLQPSEIADIVRRIHNSASRLDHLIGNFLTYVQIEYIANDKKQLKALKNKRASGIKELLEQCVRQKAQQAGRDAGFIFNVADSTVPMESEYVTKIVMELLDNAIKFSKRSSPINVAVTSSNGNFTLAVTDQGRGMTTQQIATIGAFTQFNRNVHEQQGIGLGLIIVKRLAELHGGSLKIENTPNIGTTVKVVIPKTDTTMGPSPTRRTKMRKAEILR